ncbi:MAG: hypothetical protein ABSG53_16885, partial [Thermoguttaceae bacterium]
KKFEIHPAASIFPMLSEEEFALFKEDIRVNKQQEDITLFEGKVLDGRHRLRACIELRRQVQWAEFTDCPDPIAYVLSKNLHRRHLTQSQRAQCAAEVAKMREGRPNKETSQTCLVSIDAAAKTFSVSPSSVKTAKHVAEKGDQAVVDAVKAGKITVTAAAKLVDAVPDKEAQRKILTGGKEAVAKATKSRGKEKPPKAKPIQAAQPAAPPLLRSAADDNAVAYIRSALAEGRLSRKALLAQVMTPENATRAFINKTKSSSLQKQRRATVRELQDRPDGDLSGIIFSGEQIVETTLDTMVWLGVVAQDGEDNHASYRLGVQESSHEDAADVIDFLLNNSDVNVRLLISRIVSEWRKSTTMGEMQVLADHLRLVADSLDDHGDLHADDHDGDDHGDERNQGHDDDHNDDHDDDSKSTLNHPEAVATITPVPRSITIHGKSYEVQQTHGMLEFRASPEAGWTACSPEMVALIDKEEQLS